MAVSFTDLQGAGDLLSNDRYRINFGTIPGGGDARALSVLCDHIAVPAQTVGHIRVNLLGFKTGFAGNDSSDTVLNASFYDTFRGDVLRALLNWRAFIINRADHTSPLRSEYAVSAGLSIYDTTGATALEFTLSNVFPISVQPTDLSESTGPAKHDVQFNVDEVQLVGLSGARGTTGASTNLSAANNSMRINASPTSGGNSAYNLSNSAMGLMQFADRFLR